jgi:Ca2+-binding EF-hand superfamily protein
MSFDRKMVILEAFRRLDKSGTDTVPVYALLQSFDPTTHPCVNEGRITADQAVQFMLNGFKEGHDPNGKVYWAEFLDYYKGISLAVYDDENFELLVRNAWRNGGNSF